MMNQTDSDWTATRRRFLKSAGITGLSALTGSWIGMWTRASARFGVDPRLAPTLSTDVKGRTAWAVILCRFNDLPPLSTPLSEFGDFVAGSGRGGVFDYWRDISYGAIDLTGSKVFGWYTMKYSFFKEGLDPFKESHLPPEKQRRVRTAWIDEAIRLAKENGVDLSPFYGVIAVVNASVDDSASGRNLVLGIDESRWGQSNWRWCKKCQGLAFTGSGSGACPAKGVHDHSGSSDYTLALGTPGFPGQNNWRWCKKCQGLAFAGSGPGTCPAGDNHDHSSSGDYILGLGKVGFPGQNNWRWCKKCQGLAYAGSGPGICPAGDRHDHSGSGDYTLVSPTARPYGYLSHFNISFAAHEMGHGYGLGHAHCAGRKDDYCCPWDIMGTGVAAYTPSSDGRFKYATAADHFPPLGPGLCAPQLQRLGWMPADRVKTVTPGIPAMAGGTIKLAALNRPDVKGYLMAKIVGPGGVRTVEFRQPTKWDRGLPGNAVLMHQIGGDGEPFFLGDYRAGQRWADLSNGISVVVEGIDPSSATATITI